VGDLHVVDLVMPSYSYQCWADITFLGYSPHKDICDYFMDKDITFLFQKYFRYPDRISKFHIFQSDSDISVSNIRLLFINRISIDLDIKNSKIILPIILGASPFLWGKKSPKGNILFLKEIFYCK
jgi:hypothetical protein